MMLPAAVLLSVAALLLFRIDDVAPVKVAAVKAEDEHLGGGDVGRNGDIVHIAKPDELMHIRFVLVGCKRVAEKQNHVDFVI